MERYMAEFERVDWFQCIEWFPSVKENSFYAHDASHRRRKEGWFSFYKTLPYDEQGQNEIIL